MELHRDQSQTFEFRLMQEILDRLGLAKLEQHYYTRSQVEWWNAK